VADYTLQQLADQADVTPRTIRYYIAQGLLPSPGAGPGAHYTDEQLSRLQVIKRLQASHLPLAAIRSLLEHAGDDAALWTLAPPAPPASPTKQSASDYIRSVLDPVFPSAPAWLPAPKSAPAGPSNPLPPQPDRSQWDRISLSPDVELHIRRPLTRDQNRRVDRLIAIARELLQEDQP
jgi:DNA-binding transcriptional MerR regulator